VPVKLHRAATFLQNRFKHGRESWLKKLDVKLQYTAVE